MPKIIINDPINLFLTAISILVISNHNSFRVLFDIIAIITLLPCILFEKYTNILALEMASLGNRYCANCIGALNLGYVRKSQ